MDVHSVEKISEANETNHTHDSGGEPSDGICLLSPVTEEIAFDIRYMIYGPTLFFVILFGIVGNALTFLIFQKGTCGGRKERQESRGNQQRPRVRVPKMHRYLAVLSIWDSMLIMAAFLLYNLPYLMYGRMRMYGPYVRVYPYAYAMVCVSRTGGIWILIASTVDRYFAVCHPFTHHVHSTSKRTNLVLAVCCILSCIYGWPRYYHMILEDCFDLSEEQWTTVALGSDLRSNPVYWYAYKIAADFILVSVGPFVILLCLSLAVGLAVRKSTTRSRRASRTPNFERAESSSQVTVRRNSTMPPSATTATKDDALTRCDSDVTSMRRHEQSQRRRRYQEAQNSLNFMLVTVSSKFLICHSLPAVLDVCETLMDPVTFQAPVMDDLVHAANALVIVNASINVVLYLACSRRFRIGVMQALFSGMKRQGRGSIVSSQSTNKDYRTGVNGAAAVEEGAEVL